MPFDLARAPFLYHEPIVSLILQWKFGQKLTGLETLAVLAVNSAVFSHFSTPDLIIAVPLYKSRLQERGFNQALMLARSCFPQWRDKLLVDGLRRTRPTTPQTSLSGARRRRNLKGAFTVQSPELVKGKNVLLVDDVFTTGSTVSECSRVLREGGANRIEVFTFAKTL
jgi:ComF family protein